jgi:hypothetical protein
MAALTWLTASI